MPWGFIQSLLGALVPPHDADGAAIYRYRIAISVLVMANTLGLAAHVALACGLIPVVFPGFADASGLANQETRWQQVEIGLTDQKILDTRSRQCAAIVTKNRAALEFATERLQAELEHYQELSPRPYRLPDCSEL